MRKPVNGHTPQVGAKTFVAENATLVGDLEIGEECSIWYNVVLRGDVCKIKVGNRTNIQDGTIVHGTYQKCGTDIGENVTVGHGAILHGCSIGDLTLVGMGSVIMDLAKIGKNCIVGAGSLVTENSEFPDGHLIMGRPAKAVRPLEKEELDFLPQSAKNYILYKSWYEEA